MHQRYLITGGAGFIGSHLADFLASKADVCVFDNLLAQVHGQQATPNTLPAAVEFVRGDVTDFDAMCTVIAKSKPSVIVHLAAETGTSQSFDEVSRYCEVNVLGTARLVEAIRKAGGSVRRVVLASSRAVYGEGFYTYPDGIVRIAESRSLQAMQQGDFEVRCPLSGAALVPAASTARCGVAPASIYGSTKLMQEYLLQQGSVGASWNAIILRLQNVFGPGQSMLNPYTGVLSIFCSQLLSGRDIEVFEDGKIVRDFVFVEDVVRALARAADTSLRAPSQPIDIGSGEPVTILNVAAHLVMLFGVAADRVTVTGRFRVGDIRAAFADTREAESVLRWTPAVALRDGLEKLVRWTRTESSRSSKIAHAREH